MSVPDIVLDLIERFERNKAEYKSGAYNETQLRLEFLDPLFEAMGWDVHNKQGYAAAYRDVIHEDAIKIGGFTKAPDYCFRIGGARKFFVEAKKPFVNIKEDISPAFQLRRYAWSAKLPLSVLSDFEEFAVYDCRVRPVKTDKASSARVMFLHYTEYIERWDEIIAIFSPEAIKRGSFDRYAESTKTKKGTAEVDDVFLKEIEAWRDLLARNIALRNPALTQRELNYAVQVTIDRIIFLRICEDRGIEQYGQLMALQNGENVYARLKELFGKADDRYNSGLFHFSEEKGRPEAPDELTFALSVDDKPLKEIFKKLYYPESPYEFSVLSADILGQVYEQFLGKVIRLTAGHQAKVEDKPEVKKAGGVFYTPTYIVDYIVKETVGKLLEGKTPRQAAKLRILDPACGSGSFLIGAYQHLLDWHLDRYAEVPEKHRKEIYRGPGDEWRLTTAERKRILLNNIYGVDIDAQAVEVTKLSLLLKVLEGENEETLAAQLKLFQERALPDLGSNIKCGNSLIGPDFYDDEQLGLFIDAEERMRINVFDWKTEFEEIIKGGGFDAVIGNPPYIRIHNLVDFYPEEVRFIQNTYASAEFGKVDIYVAFVEKGLALLNVKGKLGYILPNKFIRADYGVGLRKIIIAKRALDELVDFGYAQVFPKATIYTSLLFLSGSVRKDFQAKFNTANIAPQIFIESHNFSCIGISTLDESAWMLASSEEQALLARLKDVPHTLSDIVDLAITGVKTGANNVFTFELVKDKSSTLMVRPEGERSLLELEAGLLQPYWKAESLKRYHHVAKERLILYPYQLKGERTKLIPEEQIKASFPKTWQHLENNRSQLEGRQKGKLKGPSWFGLSFASSLKMFSGRKIITPTLAPTNSFSLDDSGHLFPQGAGGGCGIVLKKDQSPYYALGLMNSKLLTFYMQRISSCFQGGWFAYEPRYLNRLPIRTIDFSNPADKARHDKMVTLVERMLELHKQLQAAKVAGEKTAIQRQIDATDRAIDRLVYELYDLTEEEIKIVEEARPNK